MIQPCQSPPSPPPSGDGFTSPRVVGGWGGGGGGGPCKLGVYVCLYVCMSPPRLWVGGGGAYIHGEVCHIHVCVYVCMFGCM